MTFTNFANYPTNDIFVNREARQRRNLTEIDQLANSIKRIGLINPIVIRKTGELIAGERRLEAVKKLGWTHVTVQFVEDLPEDEVYLLELEENIRRTDLDWKDECQAIVQYHDMRLAKDPSWTQQSTADLLGKTQAEISQRLGVAEELRAGNEHVQKAEKYSVARGIVARSNERQANSELEQVLSLERGQSETESVAESPIINADFIEWSEAYAGPRFNFIHCDFPYGIEADKHDQGAGKSFGGYEDSKDTNAQLLETLGASMDNVVAEAAHLMFWFSINRYQVTLDALTAMGWSVDPFPLIWHKSDNTGILPDHNRGARRIYEAAFMASRGDRKIVRAVGNVVASPVIKTIHMSEKPREMLGIFFRMFVDKTTRMLDPTCGSGNAIAVAEELGATKVLGLEIDPEFFQRAQAAYAQQSIPVHL